MPFVDAVRLILCPGNAVCGCCVWMLCWGCPVGAHLCPTHLCPTHPCPAGPGLLLCLAWAGLDVLKHSRVSGPASARQGTAGGLVSSCWSCFLSWISLSPAPGGPSTAGLCPPGWWQRQLGTAPESSTPKDPGPGTQLLCCYQTRAEMRQPSYRGERERERLLLSTIPSTPSHPSP